MLKLYYSPGAASLAVHIALEEAGADYHAIAKTVREGAHLQPDYLAINPKGRVPSLETGHGVLTETPAILAYIAAIFPGAGLSPKGDPFAEARLLAFNNYLSSTVHVAHAHGPRAGRWADDPAAHAAMKAKVPETMAASFDLIERTMFEGPWVFGETYTTADPYLFTMTRWLDGDGVDRTTFPKIDAHYRAMAARPAVARVAAEEGLPPAI